MAEQPTVGEDRETLLNFPLAAFFRKEFVTAAVKKTHITAIKSVPENALMSIVGFMCADPERAARLKQPTVGDFIKLTAEEFRSFRGFGGYDSRAKAVEAYLAAFGLQFAAEKTEQPDLDAAELKLLNSLGKAAN